MNVLRGHIQGWKILGIFGAVLIVSLICLGLYLQAMIARRWAELEWKVDELRTETLGRDLPRPGLHSPSFPGNGWEDYTTALRIDILGWLPAETLGALDGYSGRSLTIDRAAIVPIILANTAALDALTRGAHRSEIRVPRDWGLGKDMPLAGSSSNGGLLVRLAVCKARLLEEDGKTREAISLLMDALQFCRDYAYNGTYGDANLSLMAMGHGLNETHHLITSDVLAMEDFEDLDRSLKILDQAFPRYDHIITNEALCWGISFIHDERLMGELSQSSEGPFSPGWRFLWSSRLAKVQAFDEILRESTRQANLSNGPWKETSVLLHAPRQEPHHTGNRLAELALEHIAFIPQVEFLGRNMRTRVRLLRMAAHWKATGQIIEPEDPFGSNLRHLTQGNHLKVWSIGRDGVDDGGSGDWTITSKDMVIELER